MNPLIALALLAAAPAPEEVAKAVERSVLDFVDAMSKRDLAAVRRICHADISVYEGGEVHSGVDEFVKEHLEPTFVGKKDVSFQKIENHIEVAGDMAWVGQTAVVVITDVKGRTKVRKQATTYVLVKGGGEWKVRHVHW